MKREHEIETEWCAEGNITLKKLKAPCLGAGFPWEMEMGMGTDTIATTTATAATTTPGSFAVRARQASLPRDSERA